MSESKSIKSGVYIIRCTVNGRVCVGSSIDMKRREWQHRRDLALGKHLSHHLQRAWNKYGTDAFEWSVLENVEINGLTTEEARSLLLGREQHHIEAFYSARRGFNTLPKAGSPLGVKASPETRAKISAALRGKPKSPEARAKERDENNFRIFREYDIKSLDWSATRGRSAAWTPMHRESNG